MKILMIWHDYPSIYDGLALSALNIIKHLSKKNDITLLCFRQVRAESRQVTLLERYCEAIETVDLRIHGVPLSLYRILYAIRNTFLLQNLLARNRCFFNLYYSPKMCRKFERLVSQTKFDLIYTDFIMAYLSQHIGLPKIVHTFDCWTRVSYETYKNTHRLMPKILRWLIYHKVKIDESIVCKNFDASIVVTQYEKDAFSSLFSEADIRVIPNGVDCEYFKPLDEEKASSLVFVGLMSAAHNVEGILYFHKYVYGHIKREVPDVRLYVVGREPAKEVQQLIADETIFVTGCVEDVRPYLARASVVVAPMISGSGVKSKVLEAMAMGKTVVTTSIGVQGINVTPDTNIIIADEPMLFAQKVVELLNNEQLRRRIGCSARKLVETEYSWKTTADAINKLFEEKRDKGRSK